MTNQWPEVQNMLADGDDLDDILYDLMPSPFCVDCAASRTSVEIKAETSYRIFYHCLNCEANWAELKTA